MNYTRILSDFVVNTSYSNLPEAVVIRSCEIMLDTLSCAVAGYTKAHAECECAIELAKAFGGNEESTVWFDGYKTSALMAAMANAAMVHTIDFDDTHLESVSHLGAGLLGTVLSLGEKLHSTGKEVLAAFTLGFEVAARVGNSVNKGAVHLHYKYWHPTATCGTVGCAAAAAKLMGLDAETVEMAIGFGADQAAGFRYCIDKGDFSKTMHPAWSAMRGIMAAQLAASGAQGPKGLLEYPTGLCNAMCSEPRMEYLTGGLGETFAVMNDALKMYPTIHGSHSGIEATLNVVTSNDIKAEDIEHILIKLSPLAKGQGVNYEPSNVLAARLSIPCCIALAFTKRQVTLDDFTDEMLREPEFLSSMKKVEVQPCPEFNEMYPLSGFTSEAVVTVKGGKVYSERVVYCKAHPQRPVSAEEIAAKYFNLTAVTWPREKAQSVFDYVNAIGLSKDIAELVKMM